MRSSDWSSDVCSSDLPNGFGYENTVGLHGLAVYGPNATLERCKLRGFRYDSLYGRVDVNVNGGWANFRAIDCDFGDCARNVVSLVDGHGWYFTRGSTESRIRTGVVYIVVSLRSEEHPSEPQPLM